MLTSVIKAGFVYSSEDVNVKDEINNTALYYASKNVNVQFVEYLLHLGANPNMLCCDNTPMHLALKSGNINVFKYIHIDNHVNARQGRKPECS